jgi:peroxiredoxin
MAGIAIGRMAPTFRLPSGQGPEVALEDYRGRNNVIVWFTKGMACPFCRQQMSQLARGYAQFRERGAEILEVTNTPSERARVYVQKFSLPFPYLCDPDMRIRRTWSLDVRSHGPAFYAKMLYMGLTMPHPPTDYVGEEAKLSEMPKLLADEDMGFFIVDKSGVVRYAVGGTYLTPTGMRQIPSNDEILRELDRCAQPVSQTPPAAVRVREP